MHKEIHENQGKANQYSYTLNLHQHQKYVCQGTLKRTRSEGLNFKNITVKDIFPSIPLRLLPPGFEPMYPIVLAPLRTALQSSPRELFPVYLNALN